MGCALGFAAFAGHYSTSWRNTTGFYKDRIVEHGVWAMGALAIGLGVIPMIVGIAALARPKGEPRDPKTRAFVVTSVAAIAVFLGYAAIKGAYISTVFATLVVERNVIYLGPILYAATAMAFERGVGRGWAIAVAAAFTLYVVTATPLQLDHYPYYEAHGLSILAFANRELEWPEGRIENALLVVCALGLLVALGLRLLRRGSRGHRVLAGTVAVFVLTWTLTAQVYAAEGERDLSTRIATNLPKPYDWVERETKGGSVVVVGQQVTDPTNVWLTEFFNPSVRKMWSLDGTAPGPGPILTPDLEAADGTLTPPPGTEYALGINGVELQAPVVARRGTTTLYRLDWRIAQARLGGHRPLLGRLDRRRGRQRRRRGRVHALRRVPGRAGLRARQALAGRMVRRRRAGQGDRPDRPGRDRRGPAAGPDRRDGDPGEDRAPVRDDAVPAPRPERPLARRGDDRTDLLATRARPVELRSPPAGRDDGRRVQASVRAVATRRANSR